MGPITKLDGTYPRKICVPLYPSAYMRCTLLCMGTSDVVVVSPNQPVLPKNRFPKGGIGPSFVRTFMPWFENYWHEHKRYPNEADIIQRFGFKADQVALLNSHKFWLESLDRRGIARPDRDAEELTDRQIAAIVVLTNFNDTRNPVARLASLNVTEEELYGWYSNPAFKRELARRAEDTFENVAPDATVELARAIRRGNFQAIKFYYEITGQASSPEVINLKRVIQILSEAIQKHVKDEDVLRALGAEIELVRGINKL